MANDSFVTGTWKIIEARLSSDMPERHSLRELGYYLRSLRRYRGLPRAFVAQKVGISEAYLSAIENGLMPSRKITDSILSRLATALKINASELLTFINRPIQPRQHKTWYSAFYLAITDGAALKVADILLIIFLLALFWQNSFGEWLANTGVWLTLIGGSLFLVFEKFAGMYWRQAGLQGDKVLALSMGDIHREEALRRRYAVEYRFRLMSLLMGIAVVFAILPIYIPWLWGKIENQQIIIYPILVGMFLAWGYRVLAKAYYDEARRWHGKLLELRNTNEQNEAYRHAAASTKLARQSALFVFISEALVAMGIIVLSSGHTSQLAPFLFRISTLGALYLLLRLAPRFISGNYLVPMDLLYLA